MNLLNCHLAITTKLFTAFLQAYSDYFIDYIILSVPVNGGWGSWSTWSSCSVTCGDGHRTRQRLCDNPTPSAGGSNCSDSNNEQQTCSALMDCPSKI